MSTVTETPPAVDQEDDPKRLLKWLRDERHEQDLTAVYADDLEALRDLLRIRREALRFAQEVQGG